MENQKTSNLRVRKDVKEKRGRFCRSFQFAKELLRQAFFKTDFEREKKSLEEKLITKAWIIHLTVTATRVIGAASNDAYWQKAYREKLPEKADEDFVRST